MNSIRYRLYTGPTLRLLILYMMTLLFVLFIDKIRRTENKNVVPRMTLVDKSIAEYFWKNIPIKAIVDNKDGVSHEVNKLNSHMGLWKNVPIVDRFLPDRYLTV